MESTFIDVASWVLIASVGLAMFNTFKWIKWYNYFGGKSLRHLARSALVKTAAAIPLAYLAIYRLIVGPDGPALPYGAFLLVLSVLAMILNLTFTTFAFRELDKAMDRGEKLNGHMDDH
jgi:hypothetical protein